MKRNAVEITNELFYYEEHYIKVFLDKNFPKKGYIDEYNTIFFVLSKWAESLIKKGYSPLKISEIMGIKV